MQKIRHPGFEPDKKEKTITIMEYSGSDAGENRVAALEKKVHEIEALVEGLTQELLDLKAINMEMSRQTEECNLQELRHVHLIARLALVPGAVAVGETPQQQDRSTINVRSSACAEDAGPQASRLEPAMGMIMQTDGTMKPEPRRGNKNFIVASAGYGTSAGYGKNKNGISVRPLESALIYAVEENKPGLADSA
jgi:hypothetical protein